MISIQSIHHLQILFVLLLLPHLALSAKPKAVPPPPDDLSSTSLRQETPPCGNTCRFRLCISNGTGPPTVLPPSAFNLFNEFGTASEPFVCLPSEPGFGSVRVYSPPRISLPNGFRRLTDWSPNGLSDPFTRSSIRLRGLPGTPFSSFTAGRPTGNQWSFMNRQCMIILIRVYDVVNPATGRPLGEEVVQRNLTNCVAFRTLAPYLQVKAQWDSADDFDLEVNEPDRGIVDWVTPMSDTGRLNGDGNADGCGTGVSSGRENVLYDFDPNLQSGQYSVRLNHFQRCGGGSSNWNVTVVEGGIRREVFRGTSNNSTGIAPAFGRTVLDDTFEYS